MTDYVDIAEDAFWADREEIRLEEEHKKAMQREYEQTGYWPAKEEGDD